MRPRRLGRRWVHSLSALTRCPTAERGAPWRGESRASGGTLSVAVIARSVLAGLCAVKARVAAAAASWSEDLGQTLSAVVRAPNVLARPVTPSARCSESESPGMGLFTVVLAYGVLARPCALKSIAHWEACSVITCWRGLGTRTAGWRLASKDRERTGGQKCSLKNGLRKLRTLRGLFLDRHASSRT